MQTKFVVPMNLFPSFCPQVHSSALRKPNIRTTKKVLCYCHKRGQGYWPCNFPSAEAVQPYILLQPYIFVYEEVDDEARRKATIIGQCLAEEGVLLPLNRRDLKIITMLMELKKTRNLAKQGNKG